MARLLRNNRRERRYATVVRSVDAYWEWKIKIPLNSGEDEEEGCRRKTDPPNIDYCSTKG